MIYTIREAAHRTKRSTRTIKRWRAEGMPVIIQSGQIHISEEVLLTTLRNKIKNNPINKHQAQRTAPASSTTS